MKNSPHAGMEVEEFRNRGKQMVEYICEFMSNIHNRRVTPDVGPGYLRPLLPSEPPHDPESWDDIMNDVEAKIMPGVSFKNDNKIKFRKILKWVKNKISFKKIHGKKIQ